MTFRYNNNNKGTQFAAAWVFLLPLLALTNPAGLGLTQLMMLLAFFYFANKGMAGYYLARLPALRWVLAGFGGYFLVSLARVVAEHPAWAPMDGPFRMLFALSCIGFAGWLRPPTRWFWLGACLGAISAGAIALLQCLALGQERADGFTHHAITFGDLALALGLVAFCGLSEFRKTRLAWLPLTALLCGVLASLLSGSRGGWMALPLAAIPLLRYGRALYGKMIAYAGALLAAGLTLACLLPHFQVAQRIGLIYTETQRYVRLGDATTSVGIRLELWKASWIMFSEHPLLGVGRSAFHGTLQTLAERGLLQRTPALEFSSSHNDALHLLATGGILDFGFLLLIYLAPLAIFRAVLRRPGHPARAAALAGLVLVMCFVVFGLTDVMFWLMTPKMFYAIMICTLIGFCLAPDTEAAAPAP